MSEAKKADMVTTGYVSGGTSSARGYGYRADHTNDHRTRHRSSGLLMLKFFFGKTTEMNSKILDIGAGQGARFLSTQDELSKFVSRNILKGHLSANTIKALRPITYK